MKSFKIEKRVFNELKEKGLFNEATETLTLKALKDVANVAILDMFECSLTNDECKRVRAGETIGFNRAGKSYVATLVDGQIVVYHSYDTTCDSVIVGSNIYKVQFE